MKIKKSNKFLRIKNQIKKGKVQKMHLAFN